MKRSEMLDGFPVMGFSFDSKREEYLSILRDSKTGDIESLNLGFAQGSLKARDVHFHKKAQCHAFSRHFFAILINLKFLMTLRFCRN